jgi:hypothetical protein
MMLFIINGPDIVNATFILKSSRQTKNLDLFKRTKPNSRFLVEE